MMGGSRYKNLEHCQRSGIAEFVNTIMGALVSGRNSVFTEGETTEGRITQLSAAKSLAIRLVKSPWALLEDSAGGFVRRAGM